MNVYVEFFLLYERRLLGLSLSLFSRTTVIGRGKSWFLIEFVEFRRFRKTKVFGGCKGEIISKGVRYV